MEAQAPAAISSPETTAHSSASANSAEADHNQSSAMKDQCMEATSSAATETLVAPQASLEQRKRKRSSDEEVEEGEIPSSRAESESTSSGPRTSKHSKKMKMKMKRILLEASNQEEEDNDGTEKKLHPCGYCDKVFDTWQGLGGHQNAHKKERTEDRDRDTMMRLGIIPYNNTPHKVVLGPGGIPYFLGSQDIINHFNNVPLNYDVVDRQQLLENRRRSPINDQLTEDNNRQQREDNARSIDNNNSTTKIVTGFRSEVGWNDPLLMSATGLDLFTFEAAPKARSRLSDGRYGLDLKLGK